MAKVGVATLAATAAAGKAMGHGISPQKGTAAAVNHFKQVECKDFHIGDMVEHSEDHGMSTEHYRPVLQAAMAKKRYCKRTRQPMRNPNTGKRMSKKKQRQAERRRRNQQRQEQERKNQQQQQQQQQQEEPQPGETSGSTDTGAYDVATVTAGMTAAAAHYYMRKKQQEEAERKRQQEEEENSKSSNPALFDDFGERPQALASLKLQNEPTKKKKKTAYRTFKSKLSKLTGIKRNKTRKNPHRG
jgi:hypothetical protein